MRNVAIEMPGEGARSAVRAGAERLKTWLFAGLAAIVVLAPLPLASIRPPAWNALGLAVAVLLAGSTFLPACEVRAAGRALAVPIVLFTAVALFVLVQASPWTPAAWHNGVWDQAAEGLGEPVSGSIAVDRPAALAGLFRFLAYAGIFFLSALLCRDRVRAYKALTLVTLSGGAYAVYGLAAYWSGNRTLLWFAKWAYPDDLTGTFVSRNAFAVFLGLVLLAALTQAFVAFKDLRVSGPVRQKLVQAIEYGSERVWLPVLVFLVSSALFLTHSRGGLFATLLGATALVFAIALAPSIGGLRRFGIGIVLMTFAALAFLISGGGTLDRLADVAGDASGRYQIYAAAWQAFAQHPFVGWGLGSFTSAFPIYRTTDIVRGFVNAAHDSYLENLLELGLPAALALNGALAWLVGLALRGIRVRRRDAVFPCLAVAASALVACHSAFDFSLQFPAVTVTWLFLLGLGVAQSQSSRANGASAVPE